MAELKRYLTKYVRDGAKSAYKKGNSCYICGATEELDFHHFATLSLLVNAWVKQKKIRIETAEDALCHRDEFIEEHYNELYEGAVTLCHKHHLRLHSIYGRNPGLHTAKKQARWVEIQREKHALDK